MRNTIVRGVADFVVGDDIWIAVAVALLLGIAALLERLDADAWWTLPIGVPVALWISLVRARRLSR
jgi:hypothetical protein